MKGEAEDEEPQDEGARALQEFYSNSANKSSANGYAKGAPESNLNSKVVSKRHSIKVPFQSSADTFNSLANSLKY